MCYRHIIFDASGDGVAQVTINRPEKLNALNRETLEDLGHAFTRVAGEAALRGLVVTGSGEKAFVAGADINELAAMEPLAAREYAAFGQGVFRQLETMGKPSVAAVNGYALGGGLELALACTVRFAAPDARFGQPEVKLGMVPGFGGTQRLPRLVGRGRALDLLLSGEPVGAEDALRMGLVNAVAPREELAAFARAWLAKVIANGPVAVSLAMEAVDTGLDSGLEEGLRFEAAAFGLAAATRDSREGTRAFLEKRRPAFTGK